MNTSRNMLPHRYWSLPTSCCAVRSEAGIAKQNPGLSRVFGDITGGSPEVMT